jgi:hypothetical protein
VAARVFESPKEAVEACVQVRDTIDPDPAWESQYATEVERFRALYPALRAIGA